MNCLQCNNEIKRQKTEPWEEGYCDECIRKGEEAHEKFIEADEKALERFFEGATE